MIIKSLKMKNYRPYKDPGTINFAYGDSNLTIIQGDNDLGKTTLLNAISWCLYNKEPYRKYNTKEFNSNVANELKVGDSLDVVVEIHMIDNEGSEVIFNRTRTYKKNNSGIRKIQNSEELEVHKTNPFTQNDFKLAEPLKYIETHLPFTLKDYFLFDGERLLEWFSGDSKEVKKAIGKLSQMDLIENVKLRTTKQKNILTEDLKKYNNDLAILLQEKDKLIKICEKDKEKIQSNNEEIELLQNKKLSNEKIRDNTNGNPNELLEDINDLEDDLNEKRNQLTLLTKNHMTFLLKNFSLILAFSSLKNFIINYNKQLSNSDIVKYPINDNQGFVRFIEYLIDKKECICGHELMTNSVELKNLISLKNDLLDLNYLSYGSELNIKINNYLNKYPSDINKLIQIYWNKMNSIEDKIDKKEQIISNKQEQYDSIMKDIDLDEVNKIIKKTDKLIVDLKAKNILLQKNIEDIPQKLNDINNQINLIKSNNIGEEVINTKINFCDDIVKDCNYLMKELGIVLHKQIEKAVNEEFQSIYNGDGVRNKYKKIIVDESFNIFIEKVDGELNTSSGPSSGTQLAVALAFITAINSSSGFQLPQIMDTSLGRWGKRLRNNFSKTLPKYLENHQMIFLFLDSEYEGEFKEKLLPFVGKEFLLEDNGQNDTIVKKIR